MKKHIFLLALCVVIAGSAGAIPDPSAVYCIKCGYQYHIRTDSTGGQYGACVFPDGSECEAWTFWRKCNAPQSCDGDCNCPWPCPTRIIYVDDDAGGANDGSTWQDAYKYLQDALAAAKSGDEIRVAQGIYKPDQGAGITRGARTATFQLKNGVAIKGGYAGLGARDPNAQDIEKYETILSGDLNGDDLEVRDPSNLLKETTRKDNSFHVVTSNGTNATASLDGFTVTGGNARSRYHELGGGLYNSSGNPSITNCVFISNSAEEDGGGIYNDNRPTLNNCRFIGNSAGTLGGGMCNNGGAPSLKYCTFSGNSAGLAGGAMMNSPGSPNLSNCRLIGNSADYGGGMQNWFGSPVMTNCRFIENSARYNGGAMDNRYYFGGIIRNCTFSGNLAGDCGGAMCNDRSRPMLTNCLFIGNVADRGGGIASYNISRARLTNCILWSNAAAEGREIQLEENSTLAVSYSCIHGDQAAVDDPCEGLVWGAGNIDDDPCFAALGYWDANGTSEDPNDDFWVEGDYHLKSQAGRWDIKTQSWVKDDVTSPCIDAGDPASPIDLEPFPNGGRINMGAYGGTGEASKSYFGNAVCETIIAGDINGDCKVDLADFAIMALHWLEEH
jgi:predicted outer membrane repeat protein